MRAVVILFLLGWTPGAWGTVCGGNTLYDVVGFSKDGRHVYFSTDVVPGGGDECAEVAERGESLDYADVHTGAAVSLAQRRRLSRATPVAGSELPELGTALDLVEPRPWLQFEHRNAACPPIPDEETDSKADLQCAYRRKLSLWRGLSSVVVWEEGGKGKLVACGDGPPNAFPVASLKRAQLARGGEALAAVLQTCDCQDDDRLAVSLRQVAEQLNQQGLAALSQGQARQAVARWRQAVTADPAHPEAGFNLARAAAREGSIQLAIDALRQQAQAHPVGLAQRMMADPDLRWLQPALRRAKLIPADFPASPAEGQRPAPLFASQQLLATLDGPPAPAVMAALVKRLQDKDRRSRAVAVYLLGQRGGVAAVAPLQSRLQDPDGLVRAEAVMALAETGANTATSLPAIIKAVEAAASDAGRLENELLLQQAAATLGRLGEAARPGLLEVVANPKRRPLARAVAGLGLSAIGGPATAAGLIKIMEGGKVDDSTGDLVGRLLRRGATEPLIAALGHRITKVRVLAAQSLAARGAQAAAAVPALLKVVDREGEPQEVRSAAVQALATMGASAAPAIPSLVRCLEGQDASVNGVDVALGAIGAPAIPALEQAWQRQERDPSRSGPRQSILAALAAMGPTTCAPLLGKALTDKDKHVRSKAVALLATRPKCVGRSRSVLLGRLTQEPDAGLRFEVARLLLRLDPQLEAALPVVRRALRSRESLWREQAALALQALRPRLAQAALPELARLIADESDCVSAAANRALATMGRLAAPAVPALVGLLGSKVARVRLAAIQALATIGPADGKAPSIAAIRAALRDKDKEVRAAAAAALRRLGGAR